MTASYTTAQVNAWYESVQFRTGPTATVSSYVDLLNAGSLTATQVQNAIIGDTYTFANANTVIRLYQAAFNRVSDQAGQNYWVDIMGATPDAQKTAQLQSIATQFANSTEFVAQYGVNASAPINAAVLTAFYANVLNRTPDTAGFNYWLNSGQNTAQVLNAFAQSAEFTVSSNNAITLFQQAEIAGTAATSGSLFQYGGFPTESVVMTTVIETINASDYVRDITISGISENSANQTWNSGDIINGNGRTNINLTGNGNPGAPSVVDVNNVATLNVNLVQDTIVNAVLFTGVNNLLVNQGVSGSTLSVGNAQLDTTYGASIAGRVINLGVDYSSTATGSSDTASLSAGGSLAGGGTGSNATTGRSTFNVATGNVVDAVTLATNGTNFVDLFAGTAAAAITATGSGTNDILISSAAATGKTIDFSATTGTNKVRLGTLLSTTDTIKGGSGADEVYATLAVGGQINPTVSGVEELALTYNANATFNASKWTGGTTLDINPTSSNTASVTNLNQSVAKIYSGEGEAVSGTGQVSISYATGSNSAVDFRVGATSTSSNPAVAIGNVVFANNAGALTVRSTGDAANTIGTAANVIGLSANKASSLKIVAVEQALTIQNNGASNTLSATSATAVDIDASLKNVSIVNTAGTTGLAVGSALSTFSLTSGAGIALMDETVTQTASTGADISSTFSVTAGASAATLGAINSTGASGKAVSVDLNVTSDTALATVGDLKIADASAGTSNGLVTSNVNITAGNGGATVGTVTVDAEDNGITSTFTVVNNGTGEIQVDKADIALDLDAVKGALTATVDLSTKSSGAINLGDFIFLTGDDVAGTATFTANADGSGAIQTDLVAFDGQYTGGQIDLTLNATKGNVTIDTLNVLESGTGDATATITASAASGFKVDVIDLINTGGAGGVVGISAITVSGAGAVEIGDGTGAFFNTLDTLVTSTVTGGFYLDLSDSTSAADINVTLGNAASGKSNTVLTGNGSDIVTGGTGTDTISTFEGDDTLVGGNGTNSLTGGDGADVMSGGTGVTTFVYTADGQGSAAGNVGVLIPDEIAH